MEKQNLRLNIQPEAQADIEEIWMACVELSGDSSADRMVDRIYKAIDQALLFPFSGARFHTKPLDRMDHRYILAGKYLVIYRLLGDTLVIYRVLHGATDYPKLFQSSEIDD